MTDDPRGSRCREVYAERSPICSEICPLNVPTPTGKAARSGNRDKDNSEISPTPTHSHKRASSRTFLTWGFPSGASKPLFKRCCSSSGLASAFTVLARAARANDLKEILSTEQRNLRDCLQEWPHVGLGPFPGELGHPGLDRLGPCS